MAFRKFQPLSESPFLFFPHFHHNRIQLDQRQKDNSPYNYLKNKIVHVHTLLLDKYNKRSQTVGKRPLSASLAHLADELQRAVRQLKRK
jgi:hypothetical protein